MVTSGAFFSVENYQAPSLGVGKKEMRGLTHASHHLPIDACSGSYRKPLVDPGSAG